MASRLRPVARLRTLLQTPGIKLMPCCHDALSARLVEQAGFPLTFVSGFAASAARGLPDTGLMSYAEMLEVMSGVGGALREIPCMGDGDTGYGNAVNTKRTVQGYARAGMAGIMIEDQVAPKRCGHTRDKAVIGRAEAVARVRAAVDAAREGQDDIVILARTDARATHGLQEAIERCQAFHEAGADITFLEAPHTREEMERYCAEVSGPKMANLLAGGLTPVLPPAELEAMGYSIAAFPLDLINASIISMRAALEGLKHGKPPPALSLPFDELQEVVGFPEYYAEEARYRVEGKPGEEA
jgi:2-methylisocitrate lyase-like PEP mutase family enzyme